MKAIMPAYPIDLCDSRKEAAATQAHNLILTSNSEMLRIVSIPRILVPGCITNDGRSDALRCRPPVSATNIRRE